MMKLTPPQPEQAPQAPLIKVYLTDAQFNELRNAKGIKKHSHYLHWSFNGFG